MRLHFKCEYKTGLSSPIKTLSNIKSMTNTNKRLDSPVIKNHTLKLLAFSKYDKCLSEY